MENILDTYVQKLTETESPHLILASIFRALFGRDLQAKEWGQLRKLINIYGRWRVLESFLRASGNESFDNTTKNVWGYFTAICISLIGDEKEIQERIFRNKVSKEETLKLLQELSTPVPKIIIKDKSWLISNRD